MADGLPFVLPIVLAALVFAAPIGLALLIARLDARLSRKRAEVFKAVAQQVGCAFHLQGINGYLGDVSTFDLFQHGRTRWFRNVIHGTVRGIEVCLFDYQYTMGSTRHPQCRHQTAVAFRVPNLNLPDFGLRLKNGSDRFGPWMAGSTLETQIGYRGIPLENHERFAERFQIYARHEAEVRRLFAQDRLDYFAALADVNVEAHDDRLLVYRHAAPTNPAAVLELMNTALDILNRLHGEPLSR
ncbi:MAG: hypothetical protein U0793_26360 [Gemmataceae bacterium]